MDNPTTQQAKPTQQSNAQANTGVKQTEQPKTNPAQSLDQKYRINVQCAIRRKPTLIGLPGADPNERIYRIGSCLDIKTSKNLKGIEGELEKMLMPNIIGINSTDNHFQQHINDYWGNIGVLIPGDEAHLKEDEKGRLIKFALLVKGSVLKLTIEGENDIEKKVAIISKGIVDRTIEFEEEAAVPDFLLLCFALKNKEVAKDVSLAYNSPRIKYYIFNKNIAVKQRMNIIELKQKSMELFTEIQNDDNKVNALLIMFNLLPTDFDTAMDRVIALDGEYSKSVDTMQKFVDYANDENLELKYVIKLATRKGKINSPSNTDAYYYGQILLGRNIDEAVLYLKSDEPENRNIRSTLEREIKEQ